MRARLSSCTRCTAASAVSPPRTASRMRDEPAAIGGEHAVGLEHVAMLAAVGDVARRQQIVDRRLHFGDRLAQPLELDIGILGDDLVDDDARLVQHGDADRQARR